MSTYEGQILDGRYRVDAFIGEGGMGSVYTGTHLTIGRKIAIKFLLTQFEGNDEVITRFYREALAASAIDHTSIIDVLDAGVSDSAIPYIVMEYLEGESLGDMLARTGPINLAAACGIVEPVLKALNAAHSKGIVHRDIKPDNIFLVHDSLEESAQVKLIDFGVSKFVQPNNHTILTQAGEALGTPAYMSPEQAVGSLDIDCRTDIFSMGTVLFFMLTGSFPFKGTCHQELIESILTKSPTKGCDVYRDFPIEAQKVIDRALKREPDERYASAVEMLEDMKQLSGYKLRTEQLTMFSSGITHRTCATGYLGRNSSAQNRDSTEASKLTKDLRKSPFVERSRQVFDTVLKRFLTLLIRRFSVRTIAIGLFVLICVIILSVLFADTQEDLPQSVVPDQVSLPSRSEIKTPAGPYNAYSAPQEQMDRVVQISMKGVPPRAAVYYGDVQMTSHSFLVPYGSKPIKIRVEAQNIGVFESIVIPTGNKTIHVTLTRSQK